MSYPNDNLMDKLDDVMSDAATASSALATIVSGSDVVVANFAGLKDLVDSLSAFASTLKSGAFYAPVGLISPFGGLSAEMPSGWLLCDGSAVSQTTYADLYAVLGPNAYGTDPSGQFYLPDLRGRVPFGLGTNAAVDSRSDNDGISTVANRRPQHKHSVGETSTGGQAYASIVNNTAFASGSGIAQRAIVNSSQAGGLAGYEGSSSFGTAPNHTHSVTVGDQTAGTPTDLVPYVVTNYIIKA